MCFLTKIYISFANGSKFSVYFIVKGSPLFVDATRKLHTTIFHF